MVCELYNVLTESDSVTSFSLFAMHNPSSLSADIWNEGTYPIMQYLVMLRPRCSQTPGCCQGQPSLHARAFLSRQLTHALFCCIIYMILPHVHAAPRSPSAQPDVRTAPPTAPHRCPAWPSRGCKHNCLTCVATPYNTTIVDEMKWSVMGP